MERLTRIILIIAGLLSVIACLLLIELTAFNRGYDSGLAYCRAFPDICAGGDLGAGFGA